MLSSRRRSCRWCSRTRVQRRHHRFSQPDIAVGDDVYMLDARCDCLENRFISANLALLTMFHNVLKCVVRPFKSLDLLCI